ncbi:MAG: porphobilinogen synthase [Sedimentisphaerales bacterium]|nr:porphobilinogen synthase [Sedimentisphaerales bacterium]
MAYPQTRLRRLRASDGIRRLVRQTELSVNDLVYPLFVKAGKALSSPIPSMADCMHLSPDLVGQEAKRVCELGIPAVLLFGLASKKDPAGSQAWDPDGPVQQAIRSIKAVTPDLVVITDVCLCGYTDHGHCGLIKDGKVDNDSTCQVLAKVALSHAQAGADIVAPSDMMDGGVSAIRQALDRNGFQDVAIMSYAAKFASAFYGPFRDAADSAPAFGDRKTYQMDPASADQAMVEIALDIQEGADIVMIKPALPYLDIIYRARQRFDCPIAAYNVSGEYMMIHSAAKAGLLELEPAMLEVCTAIKRAGADIIITYFAKSIASIIRKT